MPPVELETTDAPALDSLAGMVAGVDAEAAAALNPGAVPGAQPDTPVGPDYERGAAGICELVRAMVDGFAPGAGWDDRTNARMAASLAPVFEKYGWDVESSMPCELVALVVCGPVLYQSARVVALKIQTDRVEQLRAARGLADPNTVAGAQTVQANDVPPQSAADTLTQAMANAPQFPDM